MRPGFTPPRAKNKGGIPVVKVIASDVRKGNVLEQEDGQLYTVLKAETYRPGKGTPTATIERQRCSKPRPGSACRGKTAAGATGSMNSS